MRFTLSLLVTAALAAPAALAAEPGKRPNILFIYTDDQSYKTLRCYPESFPWARTPHIDALAKSGVRFHGAYLGSWCMPSRASLLTGHHPHAIQSMRMEGQYPGSSYDPKQCPFWPALFRKHGYHTAQIGKWHTGTDAGFGRDWDYQIVWNRPKHPKNAGAYYEKQVLAVNGKEQWQDGYPADNYTKWAVEYIKGQNRDKEKPWFLWLCYGSVHGPSKPAARHKGLYKDAKVTQPADLLGPWPGKPDYLKNTLAWQKHPNGRIVATSSGEKVGDAAGKTSVEYGAWVRQMNECVPAIDEGVGKLIAALKETKQLENTLVVYTADQGYAMGEHGMRMKIAPYDANYRSPLIVARPGTVAAGKVCKATPNAPDLVATFFAAAGVKPPAGLHGRDISALLKDPAAEWKHPCLYEHTGQHYGDDVPKLLKERPKDAIHSKVPWYTAVVHDGWKYIRYLQPGVPEELYDHGSDPEELKNLAGEAKHAKRLGQMREAMAAELKRTGAPAVMLPSPPGREKREQEAPTSLPCGDEGDGKAADRPNVILFLADDLGYGDLGCYGHPKIQTPHLDGFAKQGVRLTQCYSASAVCSPSRSSLLTGRTPHRNGVYTWIAAGAEVHLRKSEITLPSLLKKAGYATCHVGKWHLNGKFNDKAQPQPGDHGYDHWMATQNNAAPSHKDPTNFVRNGKPVGKMEGFSAPLVADEAIDWLENKRDKTKPFFLAVWTHEPHLPIETDPRFQKLYKDLDEDFRQHHGNVTQLDHAFGQLMKALDRQKLADNTLVFFTSDNGPEGTGDKKRTRGSTGGLRGRKRSMYEGGIRVPGIVRWPGRIKAGGTLDVPVIGSDFFPTALAACGVKPPVDRVIDGADVLPVLTGKAKEVKRPVPLYWRLMMAPPRENLHMALRDGDWKLLASIDLKNFELYNIRSDPREKSDLKGKEAERFATMRMALEKLNAEVEKEGPDWWKRLSPNGGGPLKKDKKKKK